MRFTQTCIFVLLFLAPLCRGDLTLEDVTTEASATAITNAGLVQEPSPRINDGFGFYQGTVGNFSSTITTNGPQTNANNITFTGLGAMSNTGTDTSGLTVLNHELTFSIPCEVNVNMFAVVLDDPDFDPAMSGQNVDNFSVSLSGAASATPLSSVSAGTLISTPTVTVAANQPVSAFFNAQIGDSFPFLSNPDTYDYQLSYTITITPTADLSVDVNPRDGIADNCTCFAATTAVPEPSAFLCLTLIGLLGGLRRRYSLIGV